MSNNFEAFLSEVVETTESHYIIEEMCNKVEPLLKTKTGKKRKILPLFGFGKASLLMGLLRTLAQCNEERAEIESALNLQKGVLLYLKNNFGNPMFMGTTSVIEAVPMNLIKVKTCAEYILAQNGVKDMDIVNLITDKMVDDYYKYSEERTSETLEVHNAVKSVVNSSNNNTSFDED
jgi:hypothetical protein